VPFRLLLAAAARGIGVDGASCGKPIHRSEPLTQGSEGRFFGAALQWARRERAGGRTALHGPGWRRVREPVTGGRHLRQPPISPRWLGHRAHRHYRLAPL